MSITDPQPMPKQSEEDAVLGMVIADLRKRAEHGLAKYRTLLRPLNGHDALVDAYQEVLDLAMYFRQLLAEENEALRLLAMARDGAIDTNVYREIKSYLEKRLGYADGG